MRLWFDLPAHVREFDLEVQVQEGVPFTFYAQPTLLPESGSGPRAPSGK